MHLVNKTLVVALVGLAACTAKNTVSPPEDSAAQEPAYNYKAVFQAELPEPEKILKDKTPLKIPVNWFLKHPSLKSKAKIESWGEIEINSTQSDLAKITPIPRMEQELDVTVERKKDTQFLTLKYTKFLYPERTEAGVVLKDLTQTFATDNVTYQVDVGGNVRNLQGAEKILAAVADKHPQGNLVQVLTTAFSAESLKEYGNVEVHRSLYGKTLKVGEEFDSRVERARGIYTGKYKFIGWVKRKNRRMALIEYSGKIIPTDSRAEQPGMTVPVPIPSRVRIYYDPKLNLIASTVSINFVGVTGESEMGEKNQRVKIYVDQRLFMKVQTF